MTMTIKIPFAIVNVSDVGPDDVIHVKLGVSAQDMGDGPAWLPSPDELERYRDEFEKVFPDNKVVVTHLGVDITSTDDATT